MAIPGANLDLGSHLRVPRSLFKITLLSARVKQKALEAEMVIRALFRMLNLFNHRGVHVLFG